MRKFFTLSVLGIMLAPSLLAQTIGAGVAQERALQFLQSQPQTRASQHAAQLSLAYTSQAGDETYYYVFNNAAGGFVIMGGDEAAQEVLGYSDKGTFDYARIPDNMRWWLSQYDAEISHAIGEVKAGRTRIAKATKTRASWPDIPAMLTTQWGQTEPYNCQIPSYAAGYRGEKALVTGCVATAAAQVMKYYEWPDVGVGSATMSWEYYGLKKFEADFGHTHYDWAHMTDTYAPDTYTGTVEEIAVGTLMYHLGVAMNAEYGGIYGTAAREELLIDRLADTFKYNKGMTLEKREHYSDTEWEQLIYRELSEGRPVLYCGSAYFGKQILGHEFVCDGYQDGRWHINWGWDGSYNSTFLLTASATEEALHPGGTGAGGAAADASYVLYQSAIIGLYPDKDGTSEYTGDTLVIESIRVEGDFYQPGEEATFRGSIYSHVKGGGALRFKCKLVNKDNKEEVLYIPETITVNIPSGYAHLYTASFTVPAEAKPGATYLAELMIEGKPDEWMPLESKVGNYSLPLKISPWKGISSQTDTLTINDKGYVSADSNFGYALVTNYTQETLTQQLVIWIYPEEGGDSIDYIDLGEVTLKKKGNDHLRYGYQNLHSQTLPGQPQTLVPGQTYLLRMQNLTTGEFLTKPSHLYFCASETIEYTLPETGWGTFCLPFGTSFPEDLSVYYISDIGDNVLTLNDRYSFAINTPCILHGTPGATYSFTGPASPEGLRTENKLTASTEGDVYAPKGSYVLQCHEGITGFYKVQEDNQVLVKRYEAYLVPDKECGDFISLGEKYVPPTAIESICSQQKNNDTQTYNLFGQTAKGQGFVVRDGHVVFVK